MKKEIDELEDELRPEYDFSKMAEVSEVSMLKDTEQEQI